MRKYLLSGLAAVALSAGGWFGYSWWTNGRFLESTDNAYVEADTTVVSPEIGGRVAALLVVDNQTVKAGDPLLRLDDRDYRATVDAALSSVEAQRAAIGNIDSQLTLQDSVIAQAKAGVDAAAAGVAQAQNDLTRAQRLFQTSNGSRERVETGQTDLQKAEAEAERAAAALQTEQNRVAVLQTSRQQATAELARLQSAADRALLDLDRTVIAAPVAGVVGNRGVEVGQYVAPGTQLLSLVPLPSVYVVANFKETQLAAMRVGQPVTLSVDAFPDRPLQGRVESFAPASGSEFSLLPPENATGNFTKVVQRIPVRIAVAGDNPLAGYLRPGLSIEATVDTRDPGTGDLLAGDIFGVAQPGGPPGPVQLAEVQVP